MSPKMYPIYKLRVELLNIEPVIWRELYVDGGSTLRQLHHILQVAFGWELTHPHQFDVKKTLFRDPSLEPRLEVPKGFKEKSDLDATLVKLVARNSRFHYEYDMAGHAWRHHIRVRQIYGNDAPLGRAIVISGEYNHASEQIGPAEYMELLAEARAMDDSPECLFAKLRLAESGTFFPDLCYLRDINASLARLANTGAGAVVR